MKHSSFLTIASLAIVSLPFLTSCQDEDFGYLKEEIQASVYARNFETIYGKISTDQTWDFSTYNMNRLGLEGGPSYVAGTRATGENFSVVGDYINVPLKLSEWMDMKIPEGKDNKNKDGFSTNFQLMMPGNDVLIIPIYQGQAGMNWDLRISETGTTTNSKVVWEKSDLFQTKSVTYSNTYKGEKSVTITISQSVVDEEGNIYFSLNSALQEAGFDPETEWFHVDINNLNRNNNTDSNCNGSIRCSRGGSDAVRTVTKSFSNNSFSEDVKNETILRSDNIEFVQFWPKNENGNDLYAGKSITITIKRYSKTVSDFANLNGKSDAANTIGKITRTKAIKISTSDITPGNTFSLYLDIKNLTETCWTENGNAQTWQDHYASRRDMWSSNGQMVALPAIQQDATIGTLLQNELKRVFGSDRTFENLMILGCEDSDKSSSEDKKHNGNACGEHGSDWDMNDVVFLVVGMGRENIIGNDEEIIKKRYMIEDLGSTWDFDFNDIVVDVTRINKYETLNGARTGNLISSKTTASLVHLCGTIPFSIKIGNTIMGATTSNTSGKFPGNNAGSAKGGAGFDPRNDSDYSALQNVTIDGWNPNTNNIYVTVWPKEAGVTFQTMTYSNDNIWTDNNLTTTAASGYLGIHGVEAAQTFTFPKVGQYPFIIACNPSVNWTTESTLIPNDWFRTWKPNNNDTGGEMGGDTGDGDDSGTDTGDGDDSDPETPNTSLNVGSITLASTANDGYTQGYYTFNDDIANSLQAGDVLVITADKNSFQLVFNNDWTTGHVYSPENKGNNTYELELTADQVTAIKAEHTITFNGGNNVTISALTVRKGTSGGGTITLWSGSTTLTPGQNPTITLNFGSQSYVAGDKLVFTADIDNNASICLAFNDWGVKCENGNKPTKTNTGFEITLTQDMVNALNSNKTIQFFNINGSITLKSVTLVKQ